MAEPNVSDAVRRRLAELESKADPDDVVLEMLGRVYLVAGNDKAQAVFAQVAAAAAERQRTAEFTVPTAHLYLGNLWRLAGDEALARSELLKSCDLLESKARSSDQRKPPYLFSLLLLGDDDRLLARGEEFGAKACGELCWAVVETVRAHRDGDELELERQLADWDARADAEPIDIDGRHPSHRDLRDVLRARSGAVPTLAGSLRTAEFEMTPYADDIVDGDVVGWWGHYVVLARDEIVTLYDADVQNVAYRVNASSAGVLSWDPTGVQFAAGSVAYALASPASGVVATMLRPGGLCSITGRLLAVERGLAVFVYRADGVELGVGRAPAALAPGGTAFAMATDSGLFRITTLDADSVVNDSVEIDLQCSALAWFADGSRVVCGAEASQTVHTVTVPSGDLIDSAALHFDDPIVGVAAAPSGTMVASVGFDGVLGVRRLDPPLSLSHSLGERLEDLAWDTTGRLIAVLGEQGWFVVTVHGERLDLAPASSLAWHPTERRLALGRDGRVTVLTY